MNEFYSNTMIANSKVNLQKILEFLHNTGNPFYLQFALRNMPLPPWVQQARLPVTSCSPGTVTTELALRVFKLSQLLLYRCGINITEKGDVERVTGISEQLLNPKIRMHQNTRSHALDLIGDVVSNLFCIGLFRIACAVTNLVLVYHQELVEAKVHAESCLGLRAFIDKVCTAAMQSWLTNEQRYLAERPEAQKLSDPTPVKLVKEGREIVPCKHGLLQVWNSCLFMQTDALHDSRCQ